MDRSSLEVLLAQGLSLEEIGRRFGKPAGTVGYWVAKHGLKAVNTEKYAPRGGLTRDQLEPLAARGLSLRAIGEELDRSIATVRYWLQRHNLEELRRTSRPTHRVALSADRRVMDDCPVHGPTPFALRADGYYRCLECVKGNVVDRRRRVKQLLVEEAGGACALCGYDEFLGALQFHHLDPTEKSFALSSRGLTRGIERLRAEMQKCVLLCANCHAEVEGGVVTIGSELATVAGEVSG